MASITADSFVFEDRSQSRNPLAVSRGAAFTLADVGKRFGDTRVLERVRLDVLSGEFVAIVGKSGCGKSTLLRLIAGLDNPTDGAIRFAQNAPGNPTRMMFQEPRLLPWKRVADNVLIGLAGDQTTAARHRALDLLDEVGLHDRADDWPSVLSGGQKQRVALARALASRPQVLALDEPLGALDALTRIEMQQLIERIWRQDGFTAVLVTHDVAEAVSLADRIVVIADGHVAFEEKINVPRPRRRGSPELGAIEARILDQLLGSSVQELS